MTLIAFIGSVFSPYYAWARRRRGDHAAEAESHCAVNVSLYRRAPGASGFQRLWAMTERSASALRRSATVLDIGPSRLAWQPDGRLQIDIDERTAPWPRRLQGSIRVAPGPCPGRAFLLDAAGRHSWQPISPRARIEVDLQAPALRWQGEAYLDTNQGARPLARDFRSWQWSRSALPGQRSRVWYEVMTPEGQARAMTLEIEPSGAFTFADLPPHQALPASGWGIPRGCRGRLPMTVLDTLESGPFYCRSLLHDPSEDALVMHESLSLRRFEQPWVQALLPFRMPRRAAWPVGR